MASLEGESGADGDKIAIFTHQTWGWKWRAGSTWNGLPEKQEARVNNEFYADPGIKELAKLKIMQSISLKGPKHEIFESKFFTQIRPVRVVDLGTDEKNYIL
jgi:hypothetical protein